MKSILSEIDKVRTKLKRSSSSFILQKKPFSEGMYRFSMFIIAYYYRVRKELNIDYDSFMIIQAVVAHNLYHMNKKKNSGYSDLEQLWENDAVAIKI